MTQSHSESEKVPRGSKDILLRVVGAFLVGGVETKPELHVVLAPTAENENDDEDKGETVRRIQVAPLI